MDLETFRALRGPAGLRLQAVLAAGEADRTVPDPVAEPLAATDRLRRRHPELPANLVGAALTQARLRARARDKFGADAARMYFTPDGLEQATRASVAAYRGASLGSRGLPSGARILEIGCGIGGDTVAFARAGYHVHAVDSDPLAAEVARANAESLGYADRVLVEVADAGETDPRAYGAAFCDPGRRTGRGRVFDPAAYAPPLPVALELTGQAARGCVKVAPGIAHEVVPDAAEAEWVSDGGDVKEAALWLGAAAGAGVRRRATVLPSAATLAAGAGVGTPPDAEVPVAPPRRYLYEPDGAVIRAHLVADVAARVDGALLDPTIAYVTSDRLASTPFAGCYEVTDVLPFSLKRLRALLRSRNVGMATIKKRGSAVDVERLRRDLRLSGDSTAVVVLTRAAGAPTVLLCRSVARTHT